MQVRVFTLPFSDSVDGFADEVVRQFMADKHVLAVNDHLFTRAGSPYLALVIKFESGRAPAPQAKALRERAAEPPVAVREADWPVLKALKAWRTERALRDGVPPYVVATNRILAEVATTRPRTKAALGAIPGFGEAKVARYADELLALVPAPIVETVASGEPAGAAP